MLSIYESVHLHAGRRIQLGCPAGQVAEVCGIRDTSVTGVQTCALPISAQGCHCEGACCHLSRRQPQESHLAESAQKLAQMAEVEACA